MDAKELFLVHLQHKYSEYLIWRSERDLNPCSGICSPEPRLSAIRPSFFPAIKTFIFGADDRVRTGDLNLGKVPRYQLRYVRVLRGQNLSYLKQLGTIENI